MTTDQKDAALREQAREHSMQDDEAMRARVLALREVRAESQEDAETRARDELMEVVASIPCLHKNDNPHTTSTGLLACVIEAIRAEEREAIPMVLHCPECRLRHVDTDEFATKLHHTHACQGCGFVWRPAIVWTVGVQFLPGFKDSAAIQAHV